MRGQKSEIGAMRKAQNGYWYQRTPQGWRLIHHVIMEKRLGRPLQPGERVHFKDGNKDDYSMENLELVPPKRTTLIKMETKLQRMEKEIGHLSQQIAKQLARDAHVSTQVSESLIDGE